MKKKLPHSPRPKKPAKVASPKSTAPFTKVAFPIVGIGASAGGLEALEQFLAHVPKQSGMAFVSGSVKRTDLFVTTPHFKPWFTMSIMSSATPSKA